MSCDVSSLIKNFTRIGFDKTCDQVDQGRLSGAIGTDDSKDFAFFQIKTDRINSPHPSELFGQAGNLKKRNLFFHFSTFTHRSNW